MIELQYITMDTNSWINTGIRANSQSVIYAKLSPQSVAASIDWATFWGANSSDDSSDTYQLRQYATNQQWKPQIGNTWRYGQVGTFVYGDDYEITVDVPNSLVTINNDTYTGSQCKWNIPTATPIYSIYVGANNKANRGYRASGAKWYGFYIIQSGVKVIDLIPAIDENNVVCFYDKVSGNYFYNAGSGTFTAGPVISSIGISASKTSLAASGETISIDVVTNNAWTVTGNTWLTLSSTGDTSGTTITATAPSYSGATARTDTLTFTDSVTGDEAEVAIKQKYPINGQPFYLGVDEITEIYLGADEITEAYLGDVLVFSSTSPTPPATNKTLTISSIQECMGMGQDRSCVMQNIFEFTSSWDDINDEVENQFDVYSPFSGSYNNNTITIVGPFSGSSYTIYFNGMTENVCAPIENTTTFQFSGNTAEIMGDFASELDPECDCINQGGEWDGSECHHEEPPVDPCIDDPCSCDPNPDECYCIQNGGTWDGSDCIYPE